MPPNTDPSTHALVTTPQIFCKTCGYPLNGLPSQNCPECGRPFDPTDPRTFAQRPRRSTLRRWARRLAALMILSLLTAGAGMGWLWWGWHAEQPTIARLRMLQQPFTVRPIGPERLQWVLGKHLGYLTERIDKAYLYQLGAAETEQLDFRTLSHIKTLYLYDCELSNSHLSHLASLGKLDDLRLWNLKIEKPDMSFLEKLPALSTLSLKGTWVSKAGFVHVGRLAHLKLLAVFETGMTDDDLKQFQGLSSLEELHLENKAISGAGLEHLQGLKSLRLLMADNARWASSAVIKLKEAIPDLKVLYSP